MKKLLVIFSLLVTKLLFSQEEVPFTIRYQNYIQGDLTFIANNIVNRNERQNANESYDKASEYSKLNDEFEMSYIDIDKENLTYSSSSAIFLPKKNAKEVVFAGLYWSATYKYGIGFNDNEVYSGDGPREPNINEIKIKTPSQNNYVDIKGDIIFDGYQNAKHKNNAPYVCFYDLTEMVKDNPYGNYTVANIKSTQGFIEGGVSAGWVIYFVYNDGDAIKKYITLYDGFAYVYNKPIDIKLSNFLTPKKGEINTRIALAALEGDLKIEGDNVRIKNATTNRYYPIFSKTRLGNNFFNSQITIDQDQFLSRTPSSLNTLGFDALILSLDNKKNKIIDNNTTETELRIASVGDKLYLFSAGFSIDVDEEFYEKNKKRVVEKKVNELTVADKEIPPVKIEKIKTLSTVKEVKKSNAKIQDVKKESVAESTEKSVKGTAKEPTIVKDANILVPKVDENKVVNTNEVSDESNNAIKKNKKSKIGNIKIGVKTVPDINVSDTPNSTLNLNTSDITINTNKKVNVYEERPVVFSEKTFTPVGKSDITRELKDIRVLSIKSSLKSGFYIIANVFAVKKNLTNYMRFLDDHNIESHFFLNPENNYNYVYLLYLENIDDIKKAYHSNLNNRFFDDYWILKVE
jgi:hypothetical protein